MSPLGRTAYWVPVKMAGEGKNKVDGEIGQSKCQGGEGKAREKVI